MANNYIALWLVGALIYGLWVAYKYLKFRDKLSKAGKSLVWILDKIEKDHCKLSYEKYV